METTCAGCGAKLKLGIFSTLHAVESTAGVWHCRTCAHANNEREELRQKELLQQTRTAAKSVILTTTHQIDGYVVKQYLGIESVEFVIGTGAFSEISSSFADFFGQRSSAFEDKLQTAKKHAMNALKYVAAEKGANAVIGVDLDYSEFSGNRVALIINGTLVKIAPIPSV